ncbi:MAG: Pyrroline-5-carboxylate reductase [Anaerolineales bacterium]|nr:Pyrroline-5-carboxylate reductase [Anaerolineales bacterium]
MLKDAKIAFVGSGSMAEAMIAGLLNKGIAQKQNLIASGPREERGQALQEKYGVNVTTDNVLAASGAEVVVLSVKPQVLPGVLPTLRGRILGEALVLSIVAGARIETIASGLAHANVVRSMPNTPAQIGEGITVWMAARGVSETHREQARLLLGALGEEVEADDEDQLDMATALSGTGPAYVFLFMEALVDAGVHLGFSRRVAEQLVVRAIRSPRPAALRRRRCTIWRRPVSARPSPARCGPRTSAAWRWGRGAGAATSRTAKSDAGAPLSLARISAHVYNLRHVPRKRRPPQRTLPD